MAQKYSTGVGGSACCFVLLVPTPLVYRVLRVSPGVTAPILFSPTSVAGYAALPSSLQTTPDSPVLLSEGQSGVQYLLGLLRGHTERAEDPHFFRGG